MCEGHLSHFKVISSFEVISRTFWADSLTGSHILWKSGTGNMCKIDMLLLHTNRIMVHRMALLVLLLTLKWTEWPPGAFTKCSKPFWKAIRQTCTAFDKIPTSNASRGPSATAALQLLGRVWWSISRTFVWSFFWILLAENYFKISWFDRIIKKWTWTFLPVRHYVLAMALCLSASLYVCVNHKPVL